MANDAAERIWPHEMPDNWSKSLAPVVSRVRGQLRRVDPTGTATIRVASGYHELVLPSDVWIDVEDAVRRLDRAEGAILAHALRHGPVSFKKGRVISAEDVAILREAGIETVVAARLETGEVPEDAAAAAIAEAIKGPGLSASAAFTGRVNLIAERRGLLVLDPTRLDAINLVDEALTVATLAPYALVEPGQMIATVKVIPFATPAGVLERCRSAALAGSGPPLRIAELRPRRVGLIQTSLPGLRAQVLEKTRRVLDARLAALEAPPVRELHCDHRSPAVAAAIEALLDQGCEIVLILGASAIVDRRDVIPAAIVQAGGAVEHFGMPVDPGNLILLGHAGKIPVVGLPGCARSPKLNGFDWVLWRLLADLPLTAQDLMRMGVGGLLKEIPTRPLTRAAAVESDRTGTPRAARAPRVAALVLAAGQSRRMGRLNKLLADIGGEPMVVRVVRQVLACRAEPVIVVTGYQGDRVEAALSALAVTCVRNPDYAAGLSSSLRRGLAALPAKSDAVLVCLGDMPGVTAAAMDRLIAAFDPLEGRGICVPTWQGKRGNPVLFARRFIPEMQNVAGDLGARQLIGDYPESVCEVGMDALGAGEGVLIDVDTPEALRGTRNPHSRKDGRGAVSPTRRRNRS